MRRQRTRCSRTVHVKTVQRRMRDLRWETSESKIRFPGGSNQHGTENITVGRTSIVEYENFDEGVSVTSCCVRGSLDGGG